MAFSSSVCKFHCAHTVGGLAHLRPSDFVSSIHDAGLDDAAMANHMEDVKAHILTLLDPFRELVAEKDVSTDELQPSLCPVPPFCLEE